uniref:Neurotrypsin n=1 Tax=Magallana gigas TaxID=29159 RepID=K1QGL0_MAGGI
MDPGEPFVMIILKYRLRMSFVGVWDTKETTRLVGSNVSFEGRVEVYLNGFWGTVCDDEFDMADATVVCSSLGYPGALQVRPGAAFGNGSGQILMDNVACLSSEISILECDYVDSIAQNCGHYEDVGVICER